MIAFFLDSNAWARNYFEDVGSPLMRQIFGFADSTDVGIQASIVSYVEAGRAIKISSAATDAASVALTVFKRDARQKVVLVDLPPVADSAINLAGDNLKSHDAIILATAVRLARELMKAGTEDTVVLVTSDKQIVTASERFLNELPNFRLLHLFQCRCNSCGEDFIATKHTRQSCPRCGEEVCSFCDAEHCEGNYTYDLRLEELA